MPKLKLLIVTSRSDRCSICATCNLTDIIRRIIHVSLVTLSIHWTRPIIMIVGVIAAFLCSQALGVLWYSPAFLGPPWMEGAFPGKSFEQIGEGMQSNTYLISMASYAVLAVVLNYIISSYTSVTSVKDGIVCGLVISAMVTLAGVSHLMFAQQSPVVFLVDHGFDCVVITSMCACAVLFGGAKETKKTR